MPNKKKGKQKSTQIIKQIINGTRPLHTSGKRRRPKGRRNDFLNPKSKNKHKTRPASFWHARSNHEKLEKTALAVAIDKKMSSPVLKNLKQTLPKKLAKVTTHRPIKVLKYSKHGSPKVVQTPNKSKLYRGAHIGSLIWFTNQKKSVKHPRAAVKRKLFPSNDLENSEAYQAIIQFEETVKKQTIKVNRKLLKDAAREKQSNGGRRVTSQNAVMAKDGKAKKGSATKYAHVTKIIEIPNFKWEWLHLVAHHIAGSQTMCMENLVGGTAFANTEMIAIEDQIKYLSEHYPDGFTLKITAHMIKKEGSNKNEHLQIASVIDYKIKTPDFTFPFEFNAQLQKQPHVLLKEYVTLFVESLVEAAQKTKEADQTITPPVLQTTTVSSDNTSDCHAVLFYQSTRKRYKREWEEENQQNRKNQPQTKRQKTHS